jgi:hypothetical protein
MDDPIPEEATQSDLSLGEPASDLMEDIVELPSAQKATRVPSWKRELAASTELPGPPRLLSFGSSSGSRGSLVGLAC